MADEKDTQLEDASEINEDKNSMSYMMEHPDEAPEFEASSGTQETPEEKEAREVAEKEEADKIAASSVSEEDSEPAPDSPEGRVKAAQRKMHEATEETATERKAREAAEAKAETLEKELTELRAKLPEKPASASDDELNAQVEAVAEAANEEAITQIAGLDDQDPDYNKQVAKAWAKANAKIIKAATKAPISQDEINKLIDQRYETKEAAAKVAKAEDDKKTASERAWNRALDKAEAAGLAVRDEESADYLVFDQLEKKIPEELHGKPEEATSWLIAETRARLGRHVEQTDAERQAALEAQKRNKILGKGGNFTPSKEVPPKTTLSEMY